MQKGYACGILNKHLRTIKKMQFSLNL
jgi:hypothetical protein